MCTVTCPRSYPVRTWRRGWGGGGLALTWARMLAGPSHTAQPLVHVSGVGKFRHGHQVPDILPPTPQQVRAGLFVDTDLSGFPNSEACPSLNEHFRKGQGTIRSNKIFKCCPQVCRQQEINESKAQVNGHPVLS